MTFWREMAELGKLASAMNSIFTELKRRRVYRVALVYGIFASAMIQVGGTILPIFGAAEWMQQVFVVLIVTAFPFALMLAWYFDITSEGIRRTPNAQGLRVYGKGQLWLLISVGTAIAAMTLIGYWRWHPWRNATRAEVPLLSQEISAKSIAVLPFQNLSTDAENAFFADGVQDQILTNLAKCPISRSSASASAFGKQRSDVARNAREIGQQLRVAYFCWKARSAERRNEVAWALS